MFMIDYYCDDFAGYRVELVETEFFKGTKKQAIKHIRGKRSLWGDSYIVGDKIADHRAIITEIKG